MAPAENMKLEGITFFAERPGVSYRYFIELKNSRMSIWMEDRKNKTQCIAAAFLKLMLYHLATRSPTHQLPTMRK
ncbi:hypothetical protein PC129_g5774 [Phytophthora cactorum]|uniref:Uncharacterized protein n=1 Tax=Phytophthora cactorum TaxID=29920 RepID=A0A8T1IE58_9STRA|nr:hypothetical protein PC129_g5774 [Phytophthora cactorum]